MHNTDRDGTEQRIVRAERALAAFGGALLALLGVYALGASGIPGDAFIAVIDWVVARGIVSAEASATLATVVSLAG